MKKLLALCVLLSMCLCTAAFAEEKGIYTPGTYSASAKGIGSDVTVTMTFDANSITDVAIDVSGETPGIGAAIGCLYHKSTVEAKIGRTEEYVKKLLDDSQRRATEEAKEMKLKAKEEVLQQKSELDKEINARRADIQRSERRAQQREEQLDKKEEQMDKKLDALDQREKALIKKQENVASLESEAEALKQKQLSELERIASMTVDPFGEDYPQPEKC